MRNTTTTRRAVDTKKWFFYFTLLFLLVDYGRPQDVLPAFGSIRPGLVLTLVLTAFLIRHRASLAQDSTQIKMIWCFIALLALYIPFAKNGRYAFNTFVGMLQLMPFILSVLVCISSVERLRIFTNVLVTVMIYIALYALTHNGLGSGNYFHDENDVSLFLNMIIPFCYFLSTIAKRFFAKLFYAAALTIGLLAVVASFSRGGFVGLVVMFFIVWMVSPRKLATISVILICGTAVYFYSDEGYRSEMATVTDTKEGTANERLMSWATAWDMFVDNPFGVGGNNYQVRFEEYQKDRFKRGMWGRVAHSLWFTLIPELGIVGIFIYVRLLVYNLKDVFAIKTTTQELNENDIFLNAMSLAFVASLAGFFASATFLSVLYYPHYWYLTAMIVATVRLRRTGSKDLAKGVRRLSRRPSASGRSRV